MAIVVAWDLCRSLCSAWKAERAPHPTVLTYPSARRQLRGDSRGMCWLYGRLDLRTRSSSQTSDMELERRLLLAHCTAHALSVVAGLLVVVPMALNGSAFKGRCALFSAGYWRTQDQAELGGRSTDVSHLLVQQWGPPAACQFATFVGIFTVLYGAAQGWRCLFYLHGRHDEWVNDWPKSVGLHKTAAPAIKWDRVRHKKKNNKIKTTAVVFCHMYAM